MVEVEGKKLLRLLNLSDFDLSKLDLITDLAKKEDKIEKKTKEKKGKERKEKKGKEGEDNKD